MRYLVLILFVITLSNANTTHNLYLKKYQNEQKIALVMGNADYNRFSKLNNTLNDANGIAKLLKQKGFDVTLLTNGTLKRMKNGVRTFTQKLHEGGVGFFYFAGHGMQVHNRNYLIPVSSDITSKTDVEFESLAVDYVIKMMEESHNRLNILILDACRNDPFSRGGGGLAQINSAKGMYIAFATAPGQVASDGDGENGLFTKHLINTIQKPNLTLDDIFNQTRRAVYRESNGKQLPWTSSSVIGEFYFQTRNTIALQPNLSLKQQSSNIRAMRKSCEEGDANSCKTLGIMYDKGDILLQDNTKALLYLSKALKHYQKSCNHGVETACKEISQLEAILQTKSNSVIPKHMLLRVNGFKKGCDDNNGSACNELADIYWHGIGGLTINKYKALQLLHKACDFDDADSCSWLGDTYEHPFKGVIKNKNQSTKYYKKAFSLYEKKCSMGNTKACLNLGLMYRDDSWREKNTTMVLILLNLSCRAGEGDACVNLGLMYEYGWDVNEDKKQGLEYYQKGCDLNSSWGCRNVGHTYNQGTTVVARDSIKATKYFQKACDIDGKYCENLASKYLDGSGGMIKDRLKAYKLYQRSCDSRGGSACQQAKFLSKSLAQ